MISLYQYPGACSRVTLTALAQTGVDFTAHRVDLRTGEQNTTNYALINPNAEIPALVIDGRVLTQNAAILHYLNAQYPAAGLLPMPSQSIDDGQPLSDLLWCATTLHLIRRQVLNPGRFSTGDLEAVRKSGLDNWAKMLPRISDRLTGKRWWYGDTWSIVDVYLNWSYTGSMENMLDLAVYPELLEHSDRVRAHPAFIQAIERERMSGL